MIPQDKANHFFFGALAGLAAAALACAAGRPQLAGPAALAFASLIGIVKEGADSWSNRQAAKQGLPPPHSVELLDAVSTAAGGLVVLAGWAAGAA
jgi:hypothetical protein